MYAIIRTGGKQYRVREGDQIEVDRIDASEGDELTLPEVLFLQGDGDPRIGSPLVEGATVTARVESQGRAPKVWVFRYKNKTRQRSLRGHRQPFTRIEITSINA